MPMPLTICFNPNIKNEIAIPSLDGTILLFNISEWNCDTILEGHTSAVNNVLYSKDGSILVSSSMDKTIKVWNVKTRTLVETFKGHKKSISSICFMGDDRKRWIISSSIDGEIRIWEYPYLEDIVKYTQERFKDNPLTTEERKQYYLE